MPPRSRPTPAPAAEPPPAAALTRTNLADFVAATRRADAHARGERTPSPEPDWHSYVSSYSGYPQKPRPRPLAEMMAAWSPERRARYLAAKEERRKRILALQEAEEKRYLAEQEEKKEYWPGPRLPVLPLAEQLYKDGIRVLPPDEFSFGVSCANEAERTARIAKVQAELDTLWRGPKPREPAQVQTDAQVNPDSPKEPPPALPDSRQRPAAPDSRKTPAPPEPEPETSHAADLPAHAKLLPPDLAERNPSWPKGGLEATLENPKISSDLIVNSPPNPHPSRHGGPIHGGPIHGGPILVEPNAPTSTPKPRRRATPESRITPTPPEPEPEASHAADLPAHAKLLPPDFHRYYAAAGMNEIAAYLANASYVVSLGGPPNADLKYGIVVVPVGEESLLLGGEAVPKEPTIWDENDRRDRAAIAMHDVDTESDEFRRRRFNDAAGNWNVPADPDSLFDPAFGNRGKKRGAAGEDGEDADGDGKSVEGKGRARADDPPPSKRPRPSPEPGSDGNAAAPTTMPVELAAGDGAAPGGAKAVAAAGPNGAGEEDGDGDASPEGSDDDQDQEKPKDSTSRGKGKRVKAAAARTPRKVSRAPRTSQPVSPKPAKNLPQTRVSKTGAGAGRQTKKKKPAADKAATTPVVGVDPPAQSRTRAGRAPRRSGRE